MNASTEDVNLWTDPAHARRYLEAESLQEIRERSYEMLFEWIPDGPGRALDLGCGDGEVAARVRAHAPDADVLAVDFSDEMLGRATERFADDDRLEVRRHDLDDPLPGDWGMFTLVVSAFAIHHVVDERKQALYREIFDHLEPGGIFLNLEHVASPTQELHSAFLALTDPFDGEDDASNKLAAVETQLGWLRDTGFAQVDCHYKWREIALLAGQRPPMRA